MFALIALILFVLAAFNVSLGEIQIGWLGMACFAVHFIIGGWPFGVLRIPTVTDRRN